MDSKIVKRQYSHLPEGINLQTLPNIPSGGLVKETKTIYHHIRSNQII